MPKRQIRFPHNFNVRPYQAPVWRFMQGGGKRAVCVWHRRTGKDLTFINFAAYASARRVGLYWHVAPTLKQGRKIVWKGMDKEGSKFLNHFPDNMRHGKPGSWVVNKREDDMTIEMANGSIWQVVGAEDPDSLVGPNPVGIVFTEWSVYQTSRLWALMQPILIENDGWAVFIYTARGRNHGWSQLQHAIRSDRWFSEVLTVDDTELVTKEQIQQAREDGMPEYEIQQEFYCSFDAPVEGAWWGQRLLQMQEGKRVTTVPWEPSIPVNTAWDLGMGDGCAIWFHQYAAGQHRLIDFEYSSDVGLDVYAKMLGEKPYAYGTHLAPHDIMVRELGAGGQSRFKSAQQLGIQFTMVPKTPFLDGIEVANNLLPSVWIDETNCLQGLDGLRAYVKQKSSFEDPMGNPLFLETPVHDWNSHPADAFRMLAVGMPLMRFTRRKGQSINPPSVGQFV